ncbi:MAG: ISAs1 family transposase [Deltaproteobacteria bacterium]|nr:MAG: ISAs1 family transposase [Deltaproteobacteria bacterium]
MEKSFRQYSALLSENDDENRFISCNGKVLRGSFDHFKDRGAIQILSAFLSDTHIISTHEEIATKTDEIPMAQSLIESLGLIGHIFTSDALRCQEKTLRTAKKTGNDIIVQVKGDQKTLDTDMNNPTNEPEDLDDLIYYIICEKDDIEIAE